MLSEIINSDANVTHREVNIIYFIKLIIICHVTI